jgi:predicted dehydrogenase
MGDPTDRHPTRDDAIRVALVGYGLAGAVFHAPLIATTPGLRLAVVVTSNPERREQALRDHAGVAVVDSVERLWERARDVDLVVVASPNRTHVPIGMTALAAGLHLVVDKPLAPTVAEGRRLAEEARQRGLVLVPFHNRRWDGDFLTLRRLLREGALGDPYRFESRFERWRPVSKGGWRELGDPGEAGGILFDLGSHLIVQALVLFGPVRRVYAELDVRRPGVEVDDDAFVALQHESGVHSHLFMSAVAAQLGARMRLFGSRAAFTKYGLDMQEAALRAGHRSDRRDLGEEPEERWGKLGAGDDLRPVRTESGDYGRLYDGVVAAIRDGAPPPVEPADAIAGLAIIEAARRSAARGVVVDL